MKRQATMPEKDNAIFNPVEGKWEKKIRSERDLGQAYSLLASLPRPEMPDLDSLGKKDDMSLSRLASRPLGRTGQTVNPAVPKPVPLTRTHDHPEVGDNGTHKQPRIHSHPEIGDDGTHRSQSTVRNPGMSAGSVNQYRPVGQAYQSTGNQPYRPKGKGSAQGVAVIIRIIFAFWILSMVLSVLRVFY